MKNKHMTSYERSIIESCLDNGFSFRAIASSIGKDPTTVSKEIRKNSINITRTKFNRVPNNCRNRRTCTKYNEACPECTIKKSAKCSNCKKGCSSFCSDYIREECPKLSVPPYVCNGCEELNKCTLTKRLYVSSEAQKRYKSELRESRKGMIITEEEIEHLDRLVSPLLRDRKHSVHHVYINHRDEIMMSEKTLYNIIDQGLLSARNIDLPRKVRYRKRKKPSSYKIDRQCRKGRTYDDYRKFIEDNPDVAVVQMDTVEGAKGESCLLTIHFISCNFMLAFKRESNSSRSVTEIFNRLYDILGHDQFRIIFPVILTDNGSEFSNPSAIEFDRNGNRRTYVFYCDSSAPYEKGACEVNHEFIRRIVPKGQSWNIYEQKDISLMMSHINSYARAKLNNKSPYFMFSALYGEAITSALGIERIECDDVNLTPSLFR